MLARALALHDIQDILVFQRVELEHMEAQFLDALLKCCHLFLVAEHTDHVVARHDTELRK